MVRVETTDGYTHEFDGAQAISVGATGVLQLYIALAAQQQVLAAFAPGTWTWASTTQQPHKMEK